MLKSVLLVLQCPHAMHAVQLDEVVTDITSQANSCNNYNCWQTAQKYRYPLQCWVSGFKLQQMVTTDRQSCQSNRPMDITGLVTSTHHWTCLMLRNPSKTSANELTWCRLSRTMTVGSSLALCSHCSTMFARYWRSSLLDLWSTLNVAMLPALDSFSFLQLNTFADINYTYLIILHTQPSNLNLKLLKSCTLERTHMHTQVTTIFYSSHLFLLYLGVTVVTSLSLHLSPSLTECAHYSVLPSTSFTPCY